MKKILIALLIPVLVLLAWLSSLEMKIAQGSQLRIRVRGYDPRDLLAGHYIRYSLNLGQFNACSAESQLGCVCYTPDPDGIYHSATWAGNCNALPSDCRTFLKGTCNRWIFNAGVDRYSIPERLAPVLQTVPDNSSVVISLNSSGSAQVLRFYAGAEELETYAERKLQELNELPSDISSQLS